VPLPLYWPRAKSRCPNYPSVKYTIALRASGTVYQIPDETLTQHIDPSKLEPVKHIESIHGRVRYFDAGENRLKAPEWEHEPMESALSQVLKMYQEPEVSLHPELLSILADCMRDAATRTQLIVATHADRLVRFLKPEEVVTFDVEEDGAATASRADELNLDAWLKDYTLDQVWQHGRMGGRP